jgi:putative nucleotidyltransferase with HDIG domain
MRLNERRRDRIAPAGRIGSGWKGAALAELLTAIYECRDERYALWDHSLAVGATSLRLAAAMGLPREVKRLVYIGGVLHDVGKTETPRELLFKPGPLNAAEHEQMRHHTVLGGALATRVEIATAFEAARYHHERFDGSGYPEGLSGASIPFVARVVAVADHYEAIRESRPYRPIGATRAEALAIIAADAHARQLDPLVARFLESATVPCAPAPSSYFEAIAPHFDIAV